MDKDLNSLKVLKTIKPVIFTDDRGWFYEAFKVLDFSFGPNFIQDNHSYSVHKGTIRGLHIQMAPFEQAKLVRVLKGKILDVVVDLRADSKTYLKVDTFELDDQNKNALFIPKGFAHGFITLEDHTEVYYKVDQIYSKEHELTIMYNDSTLNVAWPMFQEFILSTKDSLGLSLEEALIRLENKL
jgi:dTDP-4-dehydrorhamnose 3,5-epimerase